MMKDVHKGCRFEMKSLRLPFAWIDLEAFEKNVKAVVETLGEGQRLRVATKSLRVPELMKRVLSFDERLRGLMVYSAQEALYLFKAHGLDDFLLAYPSYQVSDLEAMAGLVASGAKFCVVVDSEAGAMLLNQFFLEKKLTLDILIDVDVSLRIGFRFFQRLLRFHIGVRRSPVHELVELERLIDFVTQHCSALKLIGAMAYEAQVAGLADRNPVNGCLKRWTYGLVRRFSMRRVIEKRKKIAALFEQKKIKMQIFNGAGSGSLSWASEEKDVLSELTAGSAFLGPHLFDHYSNMRFEPACFFALQAVRFPSENHVTCLGGGYVASGTPGWDKVPHPALEFAESAALLRDEACGEVQTPVRLQNARERVLLGSPVFFRHAKSGELAEHFESYWLVRGDRIEQEALTYRGFGKCFL